jgi:uncharacterized membrane protein
MLKYLSLAACAAVALASVPGCGNKSPEGGTQGTSSTFKISAPTLTTTIKQGNSDTVTLTLDRSSGFKESVKLTATPPEHVKVEFNKTVVAPSDPADVKMTISVAKDAPLGDANITVSGTPEGGSTATSVNVKIKIEKP